MVAALQANSFWIVKPLEKSHSHSTKEDGYFFKRKRVRHWSSVDLQKFAPRFRSLNRVILWTATCYFSCLLEPCFYFFLVGSILKMQFLEDPLDMLRHPTALRLQHTSQFTDCKFPIPTYYTTSCNPKEYISANVLYLTCSEPKIYVRTESHLLGYNFQLHEKVDSIAIFHQCK